MVLHFTNLRLYNREPQTLQAPDHVPSAALLCIILKYFCLIGNCPLTVNMPLTCLDGWVHEQKHAWLVYSPLYTGRVASISSTTFASGTSDMQAPKGSSPGDVALLQKTVPWTYYIQRWTNHADCSLASGKIQMYIESCPLTPGYQTWLLSHKLSGLFLISLQNQISTSNLVIQVKAGSPLMCFVIIKWQTAAYFLHSSLSVKKYYLNIVKQYYV